MYPRHSKARILALAAILLAVGSPIAAAGATMSLAEAVAMALEKNEQVLISSLEELRAQQGVREARATSLPRLDATLDYDRNWLLPTLVFNGNSVKIGSENNITASLSARQSLYSGGRNGALRSIARSQVAAAAEATREARQQVIAAVEGAFYDVLVHRELADVADVALRSARANLAQVRARIKAGRSSQYDALRAEVQVSTTAADSMRAHNESLLAEMAFRDIIGMDLQDDAEFIGDFRTDSDMDLGDVSALVQRALVERSELALLAYRRQQQVDNIAVERADRRPNLTLVASGQSQFQSDELDVGDRAWRKNWGTGIVMQMAVFDGLRSSARVAQARAAVQQTEYQQRMLERQIRLEVEQNWLRWRELSARMSAQEDAVAQAEKGLEVAESRFKTGAGTQLEVLNAQLALVESRTGLARARRDRAMSLLLLERAVGVLSAPGTQ